VTPDLPIEFADEQLHVRMGIEITQWDVQEMIGTMPVKGNRQPFGLLHGGANAVLAEQLGSLGSAIHASQFDSITVGLGVARPIHLGRSTATYEIVVTDEDGKRTCTARLTCLIRPKPPGA